MRLSLAAALVIVAAIMCGPGLQPAGAATLTFDDITSNPTATIPNGYGGLNWLNFSVVDPIAYGQGQPNGTAVCTGCPNGYVNGTVSGDYVAYRQGGGPVEVTAACPVTDATNWFGSSGARSDSIGSRLTAATNGRRSATPWSRTEQKPCSASSSDGAPPSPIVAC